MEKLSVKTKEQCMPQILGGQAVEAVTVSLTWLF